MAYAFYLGIDLASGERGPVATLSLVEKEQDGSEAGAHYHVRTIERTDDLAGEDPDDEHHAFAGLAARVQDLLVREPQEVGHSIPVVNATGQVGQAALRAIQARGLTPVGITLTGGEAAAQGGSGLDLEGGDSAADDDAAFFVSEADLAGRLVRLETNGRLTIEHESTRYASDLAHGLQSWRGRVDTSEQTEEAEALGEALSAEAEDVAPAEGAGETGTDAEAEIAAEAGADEATETDGEAGGPEAAASASEAAPAEQQTGDMQNQAPREAPHDAFVISAALGCWIGEERSFDPTVHLRGTPTTGEAKRMERPDTAS